MLPAQNFSKKVCSLHVMEKMTGAKSTTSLQFCTLQQSSHYCYHHHWQRSPCCPHNCCSHQQLTQKTILHPHVPFTYMPFCSTEVHDWFWLFIWNSNYFISSESPKHAFPSFKLQLSSIDTTSFLSFSWLMEALQAVIEFFGTAVMLLLWLDADKLNCCFHAYHPIFLSCLLSTIYDTDMPLSVRFSILVQYTLLLIEYTICSVDF